MTQHLIDIISDTHWDFWIPVQDPEYVQTKKFNLLFDIIVPETHSDTLIMAGDVGHYNQMNELAFNLLRERYKNILWCFGNHDLYMVSKTQANSYGMDSFNRLAEMVKISNGIDGVHYVNGNVVNVNGLNIGGCGMWYDFQYGIINHNQTIQTLTELWYNRSNDSRLIYADNASGSLDNLTFFREQYAIMEGIYKTCDIVFSHIGPSWEKVPDHYKDSTTSFYYYDGSRILENMNQSKVYLFGHTHDQFDYRSKVGGCRLICNPLGYPMDNNWIQTGFSQRIKTIIVEK